MKELAIFDVIQIGTALSRYADYLDEIGCHKCAADTREFSDKMLGSRVYVEPFNSFHHAEI